MKQKIRHLPPYRIFSISILVFFLAGCQKNQENATGYLKNNFKKQTSSYESDVVVKWMDMQLRLMRTATGIPAVAFVRPYVYSGIVLYEAVVPGMPDYKSLGGQLSDFSGLINTSNSLAYHWAASANAALAGINRDMFPATSDENKSAIDSLEKALNMQYQTEGDAETITRSIAFGKAVADKVFEWAQTDGSLHASDTYTPPVGPGFWVPTPPALAAASTPYWGNLRIMVTGSGNHAQPGPPITYSEDPSSDFYKMVKQLYDASQTLTPEQTAMALYWRDAPGFTAAGHHISILKQYLVNENISLDKAAVAYALGGIVVYDAAISCWQTKYHYNLVRPVTFIRNVLGYATWLPILTTPPHPEYSSAHAVVSAACAEAFTSIFGDDISFIDHTYDYLGMAPRPFHSFRAFGEEAGNSRFYGGIHYQPSINAGLKQGRTVAQNIIFKLRTGLHLFADK